MNGSHIMTAIRKDFPDAVAVSPSLLLVQRYQVARGYQEFPMKDNSMDTMSCSPKYYIDNKTAETSSNSYRGGSDDCQSTHYIHVLTCTRVHVRHTCVCIDIYIYMCCNMFITLLLQSNNRFVPRCLEVHADPEVLAILVGPVTKATM